MLDSAILLDLAITFLDKVLGITIALVAEIILLVTLLVIVILLDYPITS